jgi:hypothetical protein
MHLLHPGSQVAFLFPFERANVLLLFLGWANITGQITLVCSIDFTCAQMITTAIAVSSEGRTILSPGQTYGVLLAILLCHGIVCSAATSVLAKLNLFYVIVNGQ